MLEVSGVAATNTSNISTNTSNISTNATNITATGAINAADMVTNTSNISTNTSNISTNATNITATGAINAADILVVSGIALGHTTPGGSDTEVQFNDGDTFEGDSDFTWNKTSNTLTIGGIGQFERMQSTSGVYYKHLGATNGDGTLRVTVDTKTSIHPYYGEGSSSAFFIEGKESPAITLYPNVTYKFDQSDPSNNTHPLRFYYDAAKTTAYTTNVTTNGTAGDPGAYTQIEVVGGTGTPSQLFYQCSSHGYMGNYTTQNTTNLNSNVAVSNENGLLYTLPTSDASLSGYVLTSDAEGTTVWAAASGGGGGGGGAPTDAQYVTLATSAGLSDERVLAVGTGLQVTDGGAGNNVTIDTFVSTTSVTGIVQLQDSATDGTVDRAITPNAVYDVSGVLQANVDTNTSSISTNTANIATNVTNIAATGARNHDDIIYVSGVTDTNATNISTNTANIATNVTNIAATGATNAAAIVTNTTNIAATGATNATAIATNVTDIATNATNIAATGARNHDDIIYVSGVTDTNATNISTNTANIATNVTNIAATGATNAAAIVTNTTNIAATGATNATAIATNVTDIATNATNIAATGARNHDDIIYVSGVTDTNVTNISTNTANIATNVTNIAATGATNAAAIVTNTTNIAATGATNATAIATNVTDIATNATNIAATGARNHDDIIYVSGVTDTNATNISTNTANIATNVTNIAATGATNAAAIVTNTTNIVATGATNATAIATNVTDIATNATNIAATGATNAAAISTNTTNIAATGATNAAAIATNTTNIATNVTNIAATGATNAAAITANTSNIAATGQRNHDDIIYVSGVTDTNATNISTNTSNIAATGQRNHDDIIYVSGVTDTNATNISTNTSNIATNATNITATGAINAADILIVSGLGGGGISWDGSTANGVGTYKNASEATVESNLTFDGNTLTVATSSSSAEPVVIQAAASQTADLTQWQDSAGVTWASVDPTGRISASGGLVLPDNTPQTTADTLYNVGGVLNFNGSGVNGAGGGGGTPGGSDTYVQFNDGGSFGGESRMTYTKAGSGILMVNGTIVANPADAARIGVVSIGSGAYCGGDDSVSLGANARSSVGLNKCVSIGSAVCEDSYGVAIGDGASAHGAMGVAVGYGPRANAYSVAIGGSANCLSEYSVSIGRLSPINYDYSVGVGALTTSSAAYSTALGYNADAGNYSTCLGANSNADATRSIAIGSNQVTPISGLLIGQGADNWILSGNFNDVVGATNGNLVASTKFGINRTSAPDAMLDVTNFAATDVGAIIQGAASQTADLTQWQDSAGVTWASVDPTGRISASGGLVLPDNTPQTTADTLYNVGGVLNFNGSGVNGAGGGGGTPGGSDTYVQFNDGGSFGGESRMTYTKAGSGILMVNGTIVANPADAARIGVVSIGSGSYTTADNSIAIGDSAYATHFKSVAIGTDASARDTYTVAMGYDADASQTMSTAIGAWAEAVAYSTAIGCAALAPAHKAVSIGYLAEASALRSVAIGNGAVADESYSVGIGQSASTAGQYAVSLGASAGAGYYSISLGADSNANADQSIAIGMGQTTPISGLLIGHGTKNWILSGNFNDVVGATNGNLVASTKFGINRTSTPDAMLDVTNFASTDVGVIVQGAASQTADLTQWQDSAGVTWASVDPTGRISASGGLVLPDNTPVTTTNTLYNVGGVLNFNGSGVNGAGGGGGGGTPGGSDTQVQFNGGGDFEGDSALVWNSGTNVLTISGHLAATTKSFLIDHPTEPDKKLQYASLEGPENGVYVRGHTNDSIIDLPDYWTALVDQDSITVQVTAKDFAQPNLFVSGVLNNKVYLISEGAVSAYYNVSATRKDVAPLEVEI